MKPYKGPLFLFGAFALAGTSVIAARFVSDTLGTFTIAAVSLFFALIVLFFLCRHRLIRTVKEMLMRDWFILFLQAFFGIFLFRMFLLQGLIHTSSGEAGILTGVTPAATVFFSWILIKESIHSKSILGVISTITGIVLLQGMALSGKAFTAEHFVGNLLVICAAICESLFNIISRINSLRTVEERKKPIDPVVQTALVSALAFLLCLIPAVFENPVTSLGMLNLDGWLALVWYGLFVTALAFILWYAGIKRCPASLAAAFSGMMPFTAMILSVLLLNEHAQWHQWTGGFLVILGMIIIGRYQLSEKAPIKASMQRSSFQND